jgi:F-type H+-transporting ATPase subunit delta
MITKKQALREAKRLFHFCLVDGVLDEKRVRTVVDVILQARRRGYLMLLGYWHRMLKLYFAQRTAVVESAALVPADVEANVRRELANVYGQGIMAEFTLNPALIGGMRIQVGSDVYDGSVRFGLDKLQQSIGDNSNQTTPARFHGGHLEA